jgi:N-acetylglutamate synthase-like GNAT family acetyltransferase
MHVAVRDAIRSDAGAIAGLLAELGFPAPTQFAAERVAFFDAESSSRVQVAEVNGEVVGLVATHVVPRLDTELLSCRVVDIVVAADQRQSGVGRSLVAAAEVEARRQGCRRLDLSSADSWANAHAFYDAVGFERRSQGFVKRLE